MTVAFTDAGSLTANTPNATATITNNATNDTNTTNDTNSANATDTTTTTLVPSSPYVDAAHVNNRMAGLAYLLQKPSDVGEWATTHNLRSINWSDKLSSSFSCSLGEPKIWSQTWSTAFLQQLELATKPSCSLSAWLSSTVGGHPMALMGFDAADPPSPILFHQMTIQPGTGTVVHRAPILFGIAGSSFDDAIFQADHHNLDKLFKPSTEEGIWTAADIINHCVSTQATTNPTTPPVAFDKNKLTTMPPCTETDNKFKLNCTSSTPVNPMIATHLLVCAERLREQGLRLDTATTIHEMYLMVAHLWSQDPNLSDEDKAKGIPPTHPLVTLIETPMRLLWAVLTNKIQASPLLLQSPVKIENATPLFADRIPSKTPDLPPKPQGPLPSPPVVATTDSNGNQVFISQDMHILKDSLQMTLKTTSENWKTQHDENKPFNKFLDAIRKPLLLGQVTHHCTELPVQPSENVLQLFGKTSNNKTTSFRLSVESMLRNSEEYTCPMFPGHIAIVQTHGVLHRDRVQMPSGASPFCFDPLSLPGSDHNDPHSQKLRKEEFMATLHSINGVETPLNKDVYDCSKFHIPLNFDQFDLMLLSYIVFLERTLWHLSNPDDHSSFQPLLLPQEPIRSDGPSRQLQVAPYPNLVSDRPKCPAVFRPNEQSHHHRRHRTRQPRDLQFCQSTAIQQGFLTMLPRPMNDRLELCLNPNNKNKRDREQPPSTEPSEDSATKKGKGKTAATFNPPSKWLIPKEAKYTSVFPKETLSKMPKATVDDKQVPFCCLLLSTGKCKRGTSCPRLHDHPNKHGKKEEVDAFFKNAYEAAGISN